MNQKGFKTQLSNKKTLVLGASLKLHRYSNLAIKRLINYDVDTVAIGLRSGKVSDVEIHKKQIDFENIHTVSLYLNAMNQKPYYDYILSLNPKRIIFNPGTENLEFYKILEDKNIPYEESCTLVLLSTNQY